MDLQSEKLSLIQYISQIQEVSIINQIKELISSNDVELQNSLNRAIADAEAGRVKSHDEIKKKYEKWL